MQKIEIIHKPTELEPFVVINKPSGLPSAPLSETDKYNALSQAIELFPNILSVKGKKTIEYGLLHRLDTVTSGLIVIATSQEFYDILQNEQKNGRFIKTYTAKSIYKENNCDNLGGFPSCDFIDISKKRNDYQIKVESYFRPFGNGSKAVRPVTEKSGKAALKKCGNKIYTTNISASYLKTVDNEDIYNIVCKISEGYRHQVRCHLAWIGFPIVGDALYNSYENDLSTKKIEFVASAIEFTNPIIDKKYVFNCNTRNET